MLLLGPIGAVAGIFIQGEPAKVERGAELFVEILETKEVAGPLIGEMTLPTEILEPEYERTWKEETLQEEIWEGEVPQEEIEEIREEGFIITQEEPEVEIEIKPYEEW